LAISKDEVLDRVKEFEGINTKLQIDLKDTSDQLLENSNELTITKAELHRHRMEIDVSVTGDK
jgi:hypothetical protein